MALIGIPCVIQLRDRRKIDTSLRIVARQLHILQNDVAIKIVRALVRPLGQLHYFKPT